MGFISCLKKQSIKLFSLTIICFGIYFLWLKFTYVASIGTSTLGNPGSFQKLDYWPLKIYRKSATDFKVAFSYKVSSTPAVKFKIHDYLVLGDNATYVKLDFEDLKSIPDELWRLPIHSSVYLSYPQAINVSKTVERLLNGKPIEEAPINVPDFRYLVTSKIVCHPDIFASQNYDVIVVVKSAATNFDKRQNFRKLYKTASSDMIQKRFNIRMGLVFFLGQPGIYKTIHRENETFSVGVSEEVTNKTKTLLEEEINLHDDIIMGNFEDNYFNLSLKTQYAFTWVATFCRKMRPTVLFVDDDVPFSDYELIKALKRLSFEMRNNLLHGKLVNLAPVLRFRKNDTKRWSLFKSEAPWPQYPPYPYGIYILASFSNVEKLALAMTFTVPFHIDDAWLGLNALRLGTHFQNIYQILPKVKILRVRIGESSEIDKQWSY